MNLILTVIICVLVLAVLFLVLTLQKNATKKDESALLQQSIQQSLQQTTQLVLQQLNQQQSAQDRSSHLMHSRIDMATKVVSEVQGKLQQLEEANKRIFDLGKDISSLQKVLQSPKLRGGVGEIWLSEIISQIIPSDRYQNQYIFKTGETVDSVIFLHDGALLPIDSKFSLENFVKYMDAESEAEKLQHKKTFIADVKKRIDEIAKKYILPQEGTLEFAFMYVPAENVYYQAFIQDSEMGLQNYAFAKRIIPVSPSSFFAYLQVILFGLRGMEVEKNAKNIQKNLAGLQTDFGQFRETYEKVGTHLRHAQQNLDQSEKRLDRIDNKFTQISASSTDKLAPENES